MAWNEPKNGQEPRGGKNQPPDLDEALKRLAAKLNQFFSKRGRTSYEPQKNIQPSGYGLIVGVFLIILGFLWVISGIFIVDPAEQAVVLRFGRYIETVGPGPHWIPRFISSKVLVNVSRVSDYSYTAQMLTKDENLVSVSVAVQYRISDLQDYLFSVSDPLESLQQATSSALRQVVGTTTLDQLITEGREVWGNRVQDHLIKILTSYKTGIMIVNVSPQPARAPEHVQDAFDDAIKAQEDEKRFKEQARAYEARVVPTAEGNAQRIIAEAKAAATQVVLRAKGDVAEFLALLPEYNRAPFVTGERMYLDTMQRVFSRSRTLVVDGHAGNMVYLPLDQLLQRSTLTNANTSDNIRHVQANNKSAASLLYDNRALLRPTERLGRDGQ